MTLNANLKEAFDKLKRSYGTHGAAAKALGYTPGHYYKLLSGRWPISERAAIAIISKAQELSAPEAPPTPNNEVETRL